MSASSISFTGADQILRPGSDGLPYLRGDAVAARRSTPGICRCATGCSQPFEGDAGADLVVDARGCALIPGFVDCHTHLPFAGWRAGEYEQKLRGVGYEEIARSGGGIAASARALRESSDERCCEQAGGLAAEMLAAGTTCFECKSGLRLSREGELRALALARSLRARVAQTTTSTALLAHAVPSGFDADGWMDEVAAMLPEVLAPGSVSALDIFVESIAFGNARP